ncbi:hypothetical protein K488DRAFT_45294 [Vararia minispora EC-137]|uniref:Uncharacterized protein n=1 Tax=Vararia minispora EC-137 TaxID=1314806 RepID=A0ACB8QRR8_9AGAM|nr:hypothetical protein K488DRAFT_45294 [Vararia minispora EC-137]
MPTPTTTRPGLQRRKPPTFQHLPEQRAKKLKKQWVTKQKIKSQWKAQKRKEGIITLRDVRASVKDVAEGKAEDEGEGVDAVSPESGVEHNSDAGGSSSDESNGTPEPQHPYPPQKAPTRGAGHPGKPSYRELQRQAYSRENLHHFKAGRGGRSARGGRGRGRGKGGGQPDMRLRMNAMLEKIKHDMGES